MKLKSESCISKILSYAFFLFLGFSIFSPALAQTGETVASPSINRFTLTPGKMEVYVDPGETVTRTITVTSQIRGTSKFQISTEDFIGSRSENQPVVLLGSEKSPYSFKDQLSAPYTEFTLDYGQTVNIPITISAPANAQPGGYYASTIIAAVPNDQNSGDNSSQARVISRIGSLFFVRVNGAAKEEGSIEDFRLQGISQFFHSSGPFTFQILFNNTGNVHLVPYGEVSITNMFGKEIVSLPVDAYFALPNSLRYRDIPWDSGFLFGYYKAHLTLHRGYGDFVDQKDLSLLVIPWKIILSIVGTVFVLALIITFFLKNFKLSRK